MAFTLHTSNRTEHLLAHLGAVIAAKPLGHIFAKEIFLIQSQGMERWLLQGLADQFGVMANYEFLFPNKFFNQITEQVCAGDTLKPDTFARERLVWDVDAVLADIVSERDEVFPEVLTYCQTCYGEQKRFQLAQQLTQLYDQYQIFRPHLMDDMCPEHWTLKVWQRTLARLQRSQSTPIKHIGQIWQQLIDALNAAPQGTIKDLPERLSVFGIHSMPLVFVQVLQALAKHIDVHLYVSQPTEGYWADIRSKAEVKTDKLRRAVIGSAAMQDSSAAVQVLDEGLHHPLLSLLGQQGRDFHQLLIENSFFDWEFDSFSQASDGLLGLSSLARLQHDILTSSRTEPPDNGLLDDSVVCVSCHSRMREIEIVKDFVLGQLQADSTLQLRDIVVMAPNITDYQPYIEAIFGEIELPYAVADKSPKQGNQVYSTLQAILDVISGRFTWRDVMSLLERPIIQSLLELNERDLEQLQQWVDQAQIRWGKSASHISSLCLPAIDINTWEWGLAQMMRGFAMQGQTISIEGSQAQLLAKLDWFVRDHLFVWSDQVKHTHTVNAWGRWILSIIEQVFDRQDYEVQSLLNTVAQLQSTGLLQHTQSYPLATITTWLDAAITERKTSQGFMAGQLTFCSMLPMRSIPFQVVAVLGLNEGEFPRQDKRPSFDLMAHDFQLGDRSVRVDDRYQFLEVLLAARQTLYLSYVGQSQRNNQAIPPSVVVQELFDELGVDAAKNTTLYPLQPFGRQYFDTDSPLNTYDESIKTSAAAIYRAAADDSAAAEETGVKQSAWLSLPLSIPEYTQTEIDVSDFLAFAKHPYQWFIKKRLGIRLSGVDSLTPGHEVFSLDTLSRYQIEQEILTGILSGQSSAELHKQLRESGRWMAGSLGELRLNNTIEQVMPVAGHILGLKMDFTAKPFSVETQCGHYSVTGELSEYYGVSFIMARFATLKPKDYIPAALVSSITQQPVYLFGKNKDNSPDMRVFDGCELPLQQWLKAYVDAHTAPLHYLPELGWAWLEKYHGAQISKKPEAERHMSAQNGAATMYKNMLGQGFNDWMQDDHFKRLAEGQTFTDIWDPKTLHNSVELLADIFHLIKEKRA